MPRKQPQEDLLLLDSPLAPPKKRIRRSAPEAPPPAAPPPAGPVAPPLRAEIRGIVLLVGAVFIAGALLFGRTPTGLESCVDAGGPFGPVGGCIRWSILGLVGAIAAVIVPLIPATHALRHFGRLERASRTQFDLLPLGLVAIVPVAAGLARLGAIPAGTPDTLAGLWGSLAAFYVAEALGRGGAWFVIVLATSVLTAVTLGWNPLRALVSVGRRGPKLADPNAITKAESLEPDAKEMPEVDLALMGLGAVAQADTVPPKTELVENVEQGVIEPMLLGTRRASRKSG